MQWPVDFHFGYEGMSNWDQSNWNCETIRPDSGYNTHNYFCSRWQVWLTCLDFMCELICCEPFCCLFICWFICVV